MGEWVVDEARMMGANIIKLENLKNLIKNVDKLPRNILCV
ncbi:hypothetical protein IC007_0448 [Sulfuracidifex tepidarius]|uniref:Uncharacterized protein n=1 Tax=Sulfuracidifex tepidarius TaxID=1294262 RepID=A0A510E0C0_9CREN|nr:hypothetical protein IC007_0448 [Sulfuracidifex tepidarius]